MQIFRASDAGVQESKQLNSGKLNFRQLLGGDPLGDPAGTAQYGPQAFLATFLPNDPGDSIPRRSHPIPQFQVVVSGEATVGRHLVRPGSFHYSDADSASGPITPLDPKIGLTYFTLKPDYNSRPASEHTVEGQDSVRTPRSIVGSGIHSKLGADVLVTELVGPEDDGLSVSSISVPACTTFTPQNGASHGGRYLIVLEGRLSFAGTDLPAGSLVFLAPHETADFTATQDRSELLLLQFPALEHAP
ncbi:hypothetical protein ACIQH5_03125 [Paenarthrobacter sp. NPDC091711]|uniref:hypothetical protein n=1 Tax=Paenarthrobacter sp. NPDC091711 TaxID=3364385 RepID=UPI00381A38B1